MEKRSEKVFLFPVLGSVEGLVGREGLQCYGVVRGGVLPS